MNPLYIVALDMGLWKDHVTIDLPHVLSDLLPYFGTENWLGESHTNPNHMSVIGTKSVIDNEREHWI